VEFLKGLTSGSIKKPKDHKSIFIMTNQWLKLKAITSGFGSTFFTTLDHGERSDDQEKKRDKDKEKRKNKKNGSEADDRVNLKIGMGTSDEMQALLPLTISTTLLGRASLSALRCYSTIKWMLVLCIRHNAKNSEVLEVTEGRNRAQGRGAKSKKYRLCM
jgi:hypothetical protein